MANFVIVLKEPDSDVISQIKDKYPDYYKLSEATFLVSSDKISRAIAENIGIGENSVSGVVFKLNNAYSGFFSRSLWEWLKQSEDLNDKK